MRDTYNTLPQTVPDPIMRAISAWPEFKQSHPDAVNTTVGVLIDPWTDAPWRPVDVRIAREGSLQEIDEQKRYGYQSPKGNEKFLQQAELSIFGEGVSDISAYQSLGGTGALSLTKETLKLFRGNGSPIPLMLDAGWPNHPAIFQDGFGIETYDHVKPGDRRYNHSGAVDTMEALPENSVALLQACGYNDDGMDRTPEEWDELLAIAAEKDHILILDAAYLGLAKGFEEDIYPIKAATNRGIFTFVNVSMSKNMGLYNERLGALFVVNAEAHLGTTQAAGLDQAIKKNIRSSVSNPPLLVAEAAAKALGRSSYFRELEDARERLVMNRELFAEVVEERLSAVEKGKGLFAKLIANGFSVEQQTILANEGILALPNSRINLGGLRYDQVERVGEAVLKALKA